MLERIFVTFVLSLLLAAGDLLHTIKMHGLNLINYNKQSFIGSLEQSFKDVVEISVCKILIYKVFLAPIYHNLNTEQLLSIISV